MDDNRHPFLDPPWRRIVLVVICAVWVAVEFWTASPGWGMIAAAFTAYAIWRFLLAYEPSNVGGNDLDSGSGPKKDV